MLELILKIDEKLETINSTYTPAYITAQLESLSSVKDSIFSCGIYRAIRVFIQ